MKKKQIDGQAVSSTGQTQTEGRYLDKHYECLKAEYDATLQAVEIEKGWRILDAGAGSGSFLPLMAQLVGGNGHIDALDLAPENVEMINERVTSEEFAPSVQAKIGTVLKLPYQDNSYDLVWCANVTQYLSDDELATALKEMYRVIKPGGWIAIKEVDLDGYRAVSPLDPLIFRRLVASASEHPQLAAVLRSTLLPSWLRSFGFEEVFQKTFTGERSHPLTAVSKAYVEIGIATWGDVGLAANVSDEDKKQWRRLVEVDSPDYILNDPNFYYREAWGLYLGRKSSS